MRVDARARDLLTPLAGEATVLAEGAYDGWLDAERRLLAIAGRHPGTPDLTALVGERAGGRLRAALARELPGEQKAGTPLYLILDDLAGASLVAPWAWSCWDPDWHAEMQRTKAHPRFAAIFASKENICSGLRTGSSGLAFGAAGALASSLVDPADPAGWHALPDGPGTRFRRARRIDVRRGRGTPEERIVIDAHFQDSAATPEGERSVVHEYRLRASADAGSGLLLAIEAEPRVLPFPECVPAAANVARLIGTPIQSLRETVLEMLRGTAGCTHLNDALRALAEVPVLAAALTSDARAPAQPMMEEEI